MNLIRFVIVIFFTENNFLVSAYFISNWKTNYQNVHGPMWLNRSTSLAKLRSSLSKKKNENVLLQEMNTKCMLPYGHTMR